MSPTHANKRGVRYRYYTSSGVAPGPQGRGRRGPRVSAADVEKLVVEALRSNMDIEPSATDRDLIERHLDKAIVHNDHIAVAPLPGNGADAASLAPNTIEVPFTPTVTSQKGLSHVPTNGASLTETDRAKLLKAIAKSKAWIDTILTNPGSTSARSPTAITSQNVTCAFWPRSLFFRRASSKPSLKGERKAISTSRTSGARPAPELDRSGEAPRPWLSCEHRRLRIQSLSKAWFKGGVRRRAKFKVRPV